MILQLLEVILLLLDLLAQREELLLLGLADEHFLLGALASLEGVTMQSVSLLWWWWFLGYRGKGGGVCLSEQRRDVPEADRGAMTYPKPPVLGGAPVSPAPRARAVVVKAARETAKDGRAALRMVVRSMVAVGLVVVSVVRREVSVLPLFELCICVLGVWRSNWTEWFVV